MKLFALLTIFSTVLVTVSASSQQHSKAARGVSRLSRRKQNNHCNKKATAAPQGLINVAASSCGPSGATHNITAATGPNGSTKFFNCGVDGGGWNPPFIKLTDIITMDLGTAMQDPASPFHACSNFIPLFQASATQYNIPAIVLTSISMQESGCNPSTVGGAGEAGLMQVTSDKCGGAPGGNCFDPAFNIDAGAKYFASQLQAHGGDLLWTIGSYNGWFKGMTFAAATAAQYTDCCRCQNNLDYVSQYMNAWFLNQNAYSHNPPIGTYFNLAPCTQP